MTDVERRLRTTIAVRQYFLRLPYQTREDKERWEHVILTTQVKLAALAAGTT